MVGVFLIISWGCLLSEQLSFDFVGDAEHPVLFDRRYIGDGLKASGPNKCVLNALRLLIEDRDAVVFFSEPDFVGNEAIAHDPRVIERGCCRTATVHGYRSSWDRFNFSFLCLKHVLVRPRNGGDLVPMRVWRTYPVIRDGVLVLPRFSAYLSEHTHKRLCEAGVVQNTEYDRSCVYQCDLSGLATYSSAWAHPVHMGLVPMLVRIKHLKRVYEAVDKQRRLFSDRIRQYPPGHGPPIYRERFVRKKGIHVAYARISCVRVDVMRPKLSQLRVSTYRTFQEADVALTEVRHELNRLRFRCRAIMFSMDRAGSCVIPWGDSQLDRYGKHVSHAVFEEQRLKRTTWEMQKLRRVL